MTFYHSFIERALAYSITVWHADCTAAEKKRLQRVIRSAEKTICCPLSSLDDIGNSRCLSRTRKIIRDHLHPGHLLSLLHSGRRYRSIKSWTNTLKTAYFHRLSEHSAPTWAINLPSAQIIIIIILALLILKQVLLLEVVMLHLLSAMLVTLCNGMTLRQQKN